jgi:HSP90 family molecular chaperone
MRSILPPISFSSATKQEGDSLRRLEIFTSLTWFSSIEVLLLSDRVDEWMVSNFGEFDGIPLKSIAKGDLEDLDSKEEKAKKEKTAKDFDKRSSLAIFSLLAKSSTTPSFITMPNSFQKIKKK